MLHLAHDFFNIRRESVSTAAGNLLQLFYSQSSINIALSTHCRRNVNSPDLVGISEIVVAAKLSLGRDFDKSETGDGATMGQPRILLKQNSLF